MTTPPTDQTPVTVTFTMEDAEHLRVQSFPYPQRGESILDQDRWEGMGGDSIDHIFDNPAYAEGTLMWCRSYLEAKVLRDVLRGNGFQADQMWDMAYASDPLDPPYAVVTTWKHEGF